MSDSAASGTARVGPRSRDYSWQAALLRQRPETEIPREIQIAWGSAVMAAVMDSELGVRSPGCVGVAERQVALRAVAEIAVLG